MPENDLGSAKIGVVGERDTVLCFKAIGLDVFPVTREDAEESRKTIDRMARENYGIIFVTEEIAQNVGETIARYKGGLLPAIVLIPGSQGSLGLGLEKIRANVEKAVGRNIL
jgi:V/A-type H+-transporting ATPase subunit F